MARILKPYLQSKRKGYLVQLLRIFCERESCQCIFLISMFPRTLVDTILINRALCTPAHPEHALVRNLNILGIILLSPAIASVLLGRFNLNALPVQTCYDFSLAARPTTKRLRHNARDCSHMLRQNADVDATIKQHL